MNNLTVSGRLGADAEQRFLQNGTALLSFPLAVDTGFGDNKTTQWFRCAIFGKRAEGGLGEYLVKGKQVVLSGEVKLNQYQNAQGEAKAAMEVSVAHLDLVGGSAEPQQHAPQPAPAPVQQPVQQQAPAFDPDVPF